MFTNISQGLPMAHSDMKEHNWKVGVDSAVDIICCGWSGLNCFKEIRRELDISNTLLGDKKYEQRQERKAWPKPVPSKHPISSFRDCNNSSPPLRVLSLPIEIRLIIYDLVFGLADIHLMTFEYQDRQAKCRAYRLESYSCIADPVALGDRLCVCLTGWDIIVRERISSARCVSIREAKKRVFPRSGLKIMGLLLTCRAFYIDVLNVLHNHRRFQIDDLNTVILASRSMPNWQFNSIRSLYLNTKYILPNTSFLTAITPSTMKYRSVLAHLPTSLNPIQKYGPPTIWHAVCRIISSMESLTDLRVQLCHSAFADVLFGKCPEVLICNEAFVFDPLVEIAKVRDLKLFMVEVDWPAGDEAWEVKEKGFDLTRVGPRMRGW